MCKGMKKRLAVGLMTLMLLMCSSGMIYAGTLDGIGTETTGTPTPTVTASPVETIPAPVEATPKATTSSEGVFSNMPKVSEDDKADKKAAAKAIGDLFSQAGVDEQSAKEAQTFIAPFAKIINKVMAVILGITSLLMMLITVLDLLYMAFPPIRDLLDGGSQGGNPMGRQRSMPQRRTGMSMPGSIGGFGAGAGQFEGAGGQMMPGGFGMSGGQAPMQQQLGGGLSALGRWVSDEAIAACLESNGGPMGQGAVKLMIFSYMKKRSLFLILFGICAVVFTSTVFTDLGIRIGMFLLGKLMGA